MNQLISIFLPSILGVRQCNKTLGEAQSIRKLVERYILLVLSVNIVLYALVIYVFKQPNFIFTNQFTLKYLVLSSVLSYILPIVWKYLKDNINLDIRVKKNEK